VAKAISEPVRVQILDVLRRSPQAVCQCELIALFDIKQSLLSHHMKKLADSGLVVVERRHKWAYYCVADDVCCALLNFGMNRAVRAVDGRHAAAGVRNQGSSGSSAVW
jgi:DNA-binding transcriptional ArsR family regulator